MNSRKPMETKKKVILAIVLVAILIADYFIISAAVRGVQFIGDYFENLFESPIYQVKEPNETERDTKSVKEEQQELEELIGKP